MYKPLGEQLAEHENKRLDLESDVIEYREQMEPGIMRDIHETVGKAKAQTLYSNSDFYVVALIRKERTLYDSPRIQVLARKSCPTPVYRQSVWKYHHTTGNLEFLWVIPDITLYYSILRNGKKFLEDKETTQLAQFVYLMETGELLDWVKRENGELKDAVIFLDKEPTMPGILTDEWVLNLKVTK